MAIGNIVNRVSPEERAQAYAQANPPQFEPGFEGGDPPDPEDSASGEDDFAGFDSFESLGGSSGDTFGGTTSGDPLGGQFGSPGFPQFGGNGLTGGNSFMSAQAEAPKPDIMDQATEGFVAGLVGLGHMFVDFCKSAKNRTHDDWAYVGDTTFKIGLAITAVGIVAWMIGLFSGFAPLKFINFPASTIMWGLMTVAWGLICLGGMTLLKVKSGDFSSGNRVDDIKSANEIASSNGLDNTFEGDGFNFNDEEDAEEESDEINSILADMDTGTEPEGNALDAALSQVVEQKDPSEIVSSIGEVPMITRQVLLDTLVPMFPTNTPQFADTSIVDLQGEEGLSIRATLLEALASACGKDTSEINLEMKSIESNMFTYIIKFKRDKSIKNNEEAIKTEIVNYFKEDADDTTVVATVQIEGPVYKCILSKGVKAVVTMGDCFKKQEVLDFFKDTHNKLPIILGVDELGKVYMSDAKSFPSMMIVGMSRSGKSWYITSMIMAMAAFNTPEDVQFCIIDPKSSMLFKTISLLPHVCGLHSNDNIINIVSDILYKEAPRRKKLLEDNRCDSLWELRGKGIPVPYLYIVIDEVMTVIKQLESDGKDKDFLNIVIQIITQLPSLGIGIIMVPHRAQGIVDKTTRSQMHFRAAVKALPDVVKETLDETKITRNLIAPGDIMLRASGVNDGRCLFVRGAGVTLSDADNNVLIANIARAYYKMGVEIPEMYTIGCGYNRDSERVKKELNVALGNKEKFII